MYFRFSKMHTVTNTYILHLAVADECFLVGIPFLIATMSFGQWPFGMTMCKIYFTTTSINQITSSLFLMVLSADRYVAVCHPISSPRFRTGIIAKVVSLSVWLMSGEALRVKIVNGGSNKKNPIFIQIPYGQIYFQQIIERLPLTSQGK